MEDGEHDERDLETGETVYLVRHPGEKDWAISGCDGGSWVNNGPNGLEMVTSTADIVKLKWDKHRFDSVDQAYAFVAEQIQKR